MKRNWTTEQKNAIEDKGGTLLVSAAAGSGKTAVLVERIIERILNKEENIPADRLLVVTFSVAAANEMKERIATALEKRLSENPKDNYIRRQQMLLEKAQISTIHSFCLNLIRENYNLLDISPGFKIGDEKDIEILTIDTVRQVLEEEYQKGDKDFLECAELIISGKDDKKLEETIKNLYSFIRSHPFYDTWLDKKAMLFDDKISPKDSVWGKIAIDYGTEALNFAKSLSDSCLSMIIKDEQLTEKMLPFFTDENSLIEILKNKLSNFTWDDAFDSLNSVSFGRMPTVRNYEGIYKDKIKNARDKYKKIVENLRDNVFVTNEAQFKDDMLYLRPKINALFNCVKSLDKKLTEIKTEKKILDFGDLEHLALKLLVKSENPFEITDIAKELRNYFKMVVVDEYQDTNEAQEMIFKSLSKDNLFMVGDVKQSIYRFRQAMPEIFLSKKRTFSDYDQKTYPAKIIFNKNFRSRQEVTESINFIFEMIMTMAVGEIDYQGEEKLYGKAEYPPNGENDLTEIHLINTENSEKDKTLIEAEYVAKKIKELLNSGFKVKGEDGNLRQVTPSDICILMRSPKGKASSYANALSKEGINSFCDVRESFLNSREILAVVSLLKTVQNPLDDISLVGTMISPMFNFSAEEVARIKTNHHCKHFYVALLEERNDNKKVDYFLSKLEKITALCATMSAREALSRIFKLTDFLKIAGAMDDGERRKQNLYLLLSYAEVYEEYGHKSSSGFITFLDRLFENSLDMQSAVKPSDDGVTIMSIHRSKGLEFPVVFLCDTSKNFNKQDINSDTVVHSSLGFGAGRRDFAKRVQFKTLPLVCDRLELLRMSLSEEMRILYVALTRAKEKLFITATTRGNAKTLEKAEYPFDQNGKISPYNVREASSYLDWILMAAVHSKDLEKDLTELSIIPNVRGEQIGLFKLQLAQADQIEEGEEKLATETITELDEDYYKAIKYSLEQTYKDDAKTTLDTKISVSKMIKETDEKLFSKKPSFTSEKPTGANKGLAFHSFMLYGDLENAKADFGKEKQRLLEKRFMTEKELELVKEEDVLAFTMSDVYKNMSASSFVKKEMPFMAELSSEELVGIFEIPKGEKIVVQGISDVVFRNEAGELVILDYKTDNCKSAEELVSRYKNQLNLYETILKKSLGETVAEKIIYSVKLKREIKL